MRAATIQAAADLFGNNSCELKSVVDAWYAVGVGNTYADELGMTFNGPAKLCTSETYTITNLPTGATVTGWSASPSGAVTISGRGSSRTVSPVGSFSGWVTLTATISTGCGTIDVERDIYVGFPAIECLAYSNAIEEGDFLCQYDPGGVTFLCTTAPDNRFLIKTDAPHTQFEIQLRSYPSLTVIHSQTTFTKLVSLNYAPTVPGWYNIRVRATGSISCGPGPWYEDDIEFMDCSGMKMGEIVWQVFPNPANETLTVSLVDGSVTGQAQGAVQETIFTAILYDGSGREQRRGESKEGKIQFETAGLAEGTYFVHIHKGGEVEKRQVVIRH